MTVVLAIGVALVLWSAGLCLFYAWILRRRGATIRPALRGLVRRPTVWLGTALIVAAVDITAGVALTLFYVVVVALLIARAFSRRNRARR